MSEIFTVLVIAALIFIVVSVIMKANHKNAGARSMAGRTNRLAPWPAAAPPAALGVPYGHPARQAAERLEAALGSDFESRVKDRVLKNRPGMSDKEWDWNWFELKRYFLMCALLRNVPMYSRQADELWHEMLMFTREYEQFCMQFCGDMIHHAPHAPGVQPAADERAWFDWVYGELFAASPVGGRVWGAFYRTGLSKGKLEELSGGSPQELRERWFNGKTTSKHRDLAATADFLIERAKTQLAAARQSGKPVKPKAASAGYTASDLGLGGVGLLSGLLIYHSVSSPDDFARQMDKELSEEERQASTGSSTYACSASSDDGRDHGDGGSGHDGGSGGGDGGGGGSSCGSSCGGGGGCSS
ncbi:hypothetical protein KP806_26330 [Paenibacillus sp. N4]|uniref:hypothetical protein n=1 Tax=Paenibacillus vietnamensis TaxID=2590547 RepID=UPI001CD08423|nr:hypothetical protein [Paenibacillus vietnamensis]MCA0758579.1 hypothetical protein [Paenibacillus vietnamensis]